MKFHYKQAVYSQTQTISKCKLHKQNQQYFTMAHLLDVRYHVGTNTHVGSNYYTGMDGSTDGC